MLAQVIHLIPYRLRDKIRKIPLIAPLQRWIFRNAFRGQLNFHIKKGPAKGLVFPLKLPEDKLFWTGLWEKEFTERMAKAVRPGAVCLDVGAHRGYFGGVMAVSGAGSVHYFEPNPRNLPKLQQLASLNPRLPFQIHPLALGDRDGETEFFLMAEDTMGKLASSRFQATRPTGAQFKVRLARLDTLVERGEVPLPDLIKVDVEGAEKMFLDGAHASLRAKRPIVLLEYHSGSLARECSGLLEELGYRIEWLGTGKPKSLGHFTASPANLS